MGTADEVALDVLLNTLAGFSRDVAGLRRVALGGEDGVWPLPEDKRRAAAGTPGSVPKVRGRAWVWKGVEGRIGGVGGRVGTAQVELLECGA